MMLSPRTLALSIGVLGVLGVAAASLNAQPASSARPTFPLTVASIMRGPRLVGYPPSGLRWSGDGTRLY
ncbi:MAG: hypothetical protein ACR2LU_11410, partial [Luteitalea sp.]